MGEQEKGLTDSGVYASFDTNSRSSGGVCEKTVSKIGNVSTSLNCQLYSFPFFWCMSTNQSYCRPKHGVYSSKHVCLCEKLQTRNNLPIEPGKIEAMNSLVIQYKDMYKRNGLEACLFC